MINSEHFTTDYDTDQIFKLPASLFNYTILSAQHDTHPTEVAYFRSTNDKRVDVETSSSKNSRNARKDTWFILHEAVEDVSV